MRVNKKTAEHYREVHDHYGHKHDANGSLAESVDWGIRTKRLQMSPEQTFDFHLDLMSSAMNADKTADGARRRCCVETKTTDENGKPMQRTLWKLVNEAPRDFLITSFKQRKAGIDADVRSLRRDLNYANATLRERGKREIQLDLENFGKDEENTGQVA